MKQLIDQRALGDAVIERFSKQTGVPGEVEPTLSTFREAHGVLESSADATDEARMKRDSALAKIGTEDAALDDTVYSLAAKMIGCDLGTRRNPFVGFSRYSPSEMTRLAYQTEVAAVREMSAKIAAEGPPQDVTRVIGECLQQAARVEQALTELSGPQSDYDQKRAARDEAAMAWSKAFEKLKLRSKAAWSDSPGIFEALFAAPEGVQRPVARRKKAETPAEPK